jgi:hypothetical protein
VRLLPAQEPGVVALGEAADVGALVAGADPFVSKGDPPEKKPSIERIHWVVSVT